MFKPGINEVGRSTTEDVEIVIAGDKTISRRDHAEIEYDADENAFYLIRKKSAAVKLNGGAVRQPILLNPYDVIQFGEYNVYFCSIMYGVFQMGHRIRKQKILIFW